MTPLSAQAQRLRAHERWLARPSLGSIASRWAMSPAGVFLTSSPLFRLPESLQLTSSPRVLEVGTGRGALIRMLDSRLRFDRPPTGIDISAQALRLAQHDEQRGGGSLRLAHASDTALPFADGSFDLVLCGHSVRQLDDLELIELLDDLDYDEAWIGEHHSAGWETIASPELFIAAAAERTRNIKLGTGVISLPYHHPLMVANRMVQLDHLTRCRVMLGVGLGSLVSDAYMLGIEPVTQRQRLDESLGVIRRLLTETEPITYEAEWFTLREATLHLRPYTQPHFPIATAAA